MSNIVVAVCDFFSSLHVFREIHTGIVSVSSGRSIQRDNSKDIMTSIVDNYEMKMVKALSE